MSSRAKALDVLAGIHPGVARGALGRNEPFALVEPERLLMNVQQLGNDADGE
jgi:hypothetical protein